MLLVNLQMESSKSLPFRSNGFGNFNGIHLFVFLDNKGTHELAVLDVGILEVFGKPFA